MPQISVGSIVRSAKQFNDLPYGAVLISGKGDDTAIMLKQTLGWVMFWQGKVLPMSDELLKYFESKTAMPSFIVLVSSDSVEPERDTEDEPYW